MIPCRFESFGLDASFQRVFPFKQVDCHMTDYTEIFRSMIFADTAVVFPESYVQAPMQTVFDTPVGADGIGDGSGVVIEAGDEVRFFYRGFSFYFPLACDHSNSFRNYSA